MLYLDTRKIERQTSSLIKSSTQLTTTTTTTTLLPKPQFSQVPSLQYIQVVPKETPPHPFAIRINANNLPHNPECPPSPYILQTEEIKNVNLKRIADSVK